MTILEPTLRERFLGGETVYGTFQVVDAPTVSDIVGRSGLDFVVLDQEHGPLDAETSLGLCAAAQAVGCAPVVRVRANDPAEIQRALDVGAAGVQIPQIESVADAEAAAEAARFAPVGSRGLSPYVRAGGYVGGENYTEEQNENAAVVVHIEGERALEEVEGIAAVEGIDALFVGPYDLSQSLGVPGEIGDPRITKAMAEVCSVAAAADTAVGAFASDPAMARRWEEAGADYVVVGLAATYLAQRLHELRDELG
jgi:4-hydroxy-2-oxoheptanedioate aldolase